MNTSNKPSSGTMQLAIDALADHEIRKLYQDGYDAYAGPKQFQHASNYQDYHAAGLRHVIAALAPTVQDAEPECAVRGAEALPLCVGSCAKRGVCAERSVTQPAGANSAVEAWKSLTVQAIEVLNRHIVPDGISDKDALSELYGIFDGPAYRNVADVAQDQCDARQQQEMAIDRMAKFPAPTPHAAPNPLADKSVQRESQEMLTTEQVVFRVYKGEVCYKSDEDDQSYGMWCPLSYNTPHSFPEGTEFYIARAALAQSAAVADVATCKCDPEGKYGLAAMATPTASTVNEVSNTPPAPAEK